eukprot:CAMPEP_0173173344 /NCGR_PEP_ID=MMETSP1141-20130122/2784_1 /TAXON_ID=483371 /ORGANISM="non described non described, Strain CCMP2298" /LENGTH=100 /DNA_ID=CAMNT_0014095425 /DNA_START=956 /DNA_END=1258 /DNA_ORIENTATION=-
MGSFLGRGEEGPGEGGGLVTCYDKVENALQGFQRVECAPPEEGALYVEARLVQAVEAVLGLLRHGLHLRVPVLGRGPPTVVQLCGALNGHRQWPEASADG